MAKKKRLPKIKRQTWRRWRRDRRLLAFCLVVLMAISFGAGVLYMRLQPIDQHPANLVWATDKTVNIPTDLVHYLQARNDCRGYRGTGSPIGVGVWAVYQVSHYKFAKIAYGCSTNLTNYIMAVKPHDKWQLLQPGQYFSPKGGFLPKCSEVELYQIDQSIEPFCMTDNGTARPNAVKG